MNATGRTGRDKQYIFPSLNFSCGGVIRSWVLKRFEINSGSGNGSILEGDIIVLQLWRQLQDAGTESIYTLQTEQTHTARSRNTPSYAFTASPSVTVTAGAVFGFYIPSGTGTGGGLRVATATLSEHIMFTLQTDAQSTKITIASTRCMFPLISIEFSKSMT